MTTAVFVLHSYFDASGSCGVFIWSLRRYHFPGIVIPRLCREISTMGVSEHVMSISFSALDGQAVRPMDDGLFLSYQDGDFRGGLMMGFVVFFTS